MNTNEIRQKFLNYFRERNHEIVSSCPLIPPNDPTLLFTNAGMVPFKDVFLGKEKRPYTRAVSSQRCVRAGGKHNDLDNVGYTARHHTFFEMLGNFSFGDYFKKEAIVYAWQFLTEVLNLSPERLWVTVFHEDHEAEAIWLNDIKVSPDRLSRCGEKDNFWSMGDTGPCGPCTEIFYDHGPEIPGDPPGTSEEEGERYVEIWNLVFMQYNRQSDGTLTPLPKPSVDTGMGLERVAAVMQGVHSNYDIDLFRNLIQVIAKLAGTERYDDQSLCVIADHIRSSAFLVLDGVRPSNEGRGYVLRRIIRRALRHGHRLGLHDAFFYKLVAPLASEMGEAYPELVAAKETAEQVLRREEAQFSDTLTYGLKLFEQEVEKLTDRTLPGPVIFRLYDTYGFPPDLTADMARERGLSVDYAGFEAEMAGQRARSKQASQFDVDYTQTLDIAGETEFTGYEHVSGTGTVTALIVDEQPVNEMKADQQGMVVLNRTPFYAESGGQVGDKGLLVFESGQFRVHNTQKQGRVYLHQGTLEKGHLNVGDTVDAEVDSSRQAIMLNHTATHLLHAALRRILGDQVVQKGSLVDAKRLRFDFAYPNSLTSEQLENVERLVNQQIRANLVGSIDITSPDEAIKQGALALFGEKYGEHVRVLRLGEFSMELCGGTHVENTGEIGFFKIISEAGIAAGIRRIEALTGDAALAWVHAAEQQLKQTTVLLKTDTAQLIPKVEQLLSELKAQQKLTTQLKQKWAQQESEQLLTQCVERQGVHILSAEFPDVDLDTLRRTADQFKQRWEKSVILLATVVQNKIYFVASVTKNLTQYVAAGDLVRFVAEQVDGKGGGRPELAQGGGENVQALPQALASVALWVDEKLNVSK